jgi:hypothetical protein
MLFGVKLKRLGTIVILNVTEGGVKYLLYLPFNIGAVAPLNQTPRLTRWQPRRHERWARFPAGPLKRL